ncbi:MAG: hypothetical protein HY673_02615 [Chloroflexi bacterium]|nr:hypothetical protein [Chloroflexota bacterium]
MIKSRVKIFPQKLLSQRAIKLLEAFTAEGGDIDAFRDAFEDLIAELEVNPDTTPETKALFRLWLYLHEADEGFRDIEEAYIYARDLLEAERLARCDSAGRGSNLPH